MTPPKSPRTYGDLFTEITTKNILTPEEEVALRDRVINKYGMLGLGKKRKELITERTHTELVELLADLPNKSNILAKLDPLLPGRQEAANPTIANKTEGESIKDAKRPPSLSETAGGEKAGATIEAGAQKLKTSLTSLKGSSPLSVEQTGEKLLASIEQTTTALTVAGAAVMVAPTLETKAAALDDVSSVIGSAWGVISEFFSKILEAISLIFSGKFSEALTALKGSIGIGSGEAKADQANPPGKPSTEKPTLSPAEKREALRSKSWETFLKKYGAWIKDGDRVYAEKNFKSLWEEYAKGMQEIPEDIAKRIASGDIINPIVSGEKTLKTNVSFLMELINKGVLPIEALKSQMMFGVSAGIQIGIRTVRSLVDSSTHQVDDMIGYLSGEDLAGLSPEHKKVLFAHFYHNLSFATWFMGRTASLVTRAAFLAPSWENATGWNQAKAGYHTLFGEMDSAAMEIEKIAGLMGADTGKVSEQVSAARKAVGSIHIEQMTKLMVTEAFIAHKGDYAGVRKALRDIRLEAMKPGATIKCDIATLDQLLEIRDPGDAAKYRQSYSNMVGNLRNPTGNITVPKELLMKMKESIGSLQWEQSANELRGSAQNMNKALEARIMHFDSPVFNEYHKLRSAAATTKYAHYLDKNILPIAVNDTNEAKAVIQRLQYQKLPGAAGAFFDNISFLVITKHAVDEGSAKTFFSDIIDLNPLVSGIALVKEGFDIETSGGSLRMDKIGYIGAGGALLGLTAFMWYQIASAPTAAARALAFGNFAAGPVMAGGRFALGSIQSMRLTGEYLRHWNTPGGVDALKKLGTSLKGAGRVAVLGSVILGALGAYSWYQGKRDEEMTADLKSRKILKADGSWDEDVLRREFAGLTTDIKVKCYDQFSSVILGDTPHRSTYDKATRTHTVELTDPKNKGTIGLDKVEGIRAISEMTGEKSIVTFTASAKKHVSEILSSLPINEGVMGELKKNFGI